MRCHILFFPPVFLSIRSGRGISNRNSKRHGQVLWLSELLIKPLPSLESMAFGGRSVSLGLAGCWYMLWVCIVGAPELCAHGTLSALSVCAASRNACINSVQTPALSSHWTSLRKQKARMKLSGKPRGQQSNEPNEGELSLMEVVLLRPQAWRQHSDPSQSSWGSMPKKAEGATRLW
jgi:hypothetical protein